MCVVMLFSVCQCLCASVCVCVCVCVSVCVCVCLMPCILVFGGDSEAWEAEDLSCHVSVLQEVIQKFEKLKMRVHVAGGDSEV